MTECCVSAVMPAFDDDGSRDRTLEIAGKLESADDRFRVVAQGYNQGKALPFGEGFALATAPIVVEQDADLEYDPADCEVLIERILEDKADVV